MIEEWKKLIEYLTLLKSTSWSTRFGGLVKWNVIIFLSCSTIVGIVNKLFTQDLISSKLYLFSLISLITTNTFIWLAYRWLFVTGFSFKESIKVAFAINTISQSQDFLKQIINVFKNELASFGFEKVIEVYELPDDIKFQNSQSAEKYLRDKNIRLLIWGNTTEGAVKKDDVSKFNLNFSYLTAPLYLPEHRSSFSRLVSYAFPRLGWHVFKSNSLFGINVVSDNIFEVTLFIFGLCLSTIPELKFFQKFIYTFEKLDFRLKFKQAWNKRI